jgi:hypothetical protein
MNFKFYSPIFLLLVFLCPIYCAENLYHLEIGLGPSFLKRHISCGICGTRQFQRNELSIGANFNWHSGLFETSDHANDIYFQYGKYFKSNYFLLSGSCGLSFVFGAKTVDYFSRGTSLFDTGNPIVDHYYTVGLPIQGKAMLPLSRYFGICLSLFGDINIEQSFGGALLNLLFGKIR